MSKVAFTGFKVANPELTDNIKEVFDNGAITKEKLLKLKQKLTEKGSFNFPLVKNESGEGTSFFSAAVITIPTSEISKLVEVKEEIKELTKQKGEEEEEEVPEEIQVYSGYHNVWLRDNIHVAYALYVDGQVQLAIDNLQSIAYFYQKYRHRFVTAVFGESDEFLWNVMVRPHIRFNGTTVSENEEGWGHSQNDALGYFLWLICKIAREVGYDKVIRNAKDEDILCLIVFYLEALCFYTDEDSGHWEEGRKNCASSVGPVCAGLREFCLLFEDRIKDDDDTGKKVVVKKKGRSLEQFHQDEKEMKAKLKLENEQKEKLEEETASKRPEHEEANDLPPAKHFKADNGEIGNTLENEKEESAEETVLKPEESKNIKDDFLQQQYKEPFKVNKQVLKMAQDLFAIGKIRLDELLPYECTQAEPHKYREFDAATLFLIYPLNIVTADQREAIVKNTLEHLCGEYGIKRYLGDSYWCGDYLKVFDEENNEDDGINSDRNNCLKPGEEAQWCIFDPILSICFSPEVLGDNISDSQREQQLLFLKRSLGQITKDYFCPESYYKSNGSYIPNDVCPLLWTQANLLCSINVLLKHLSQ